MINHKAEIPVALLLLPFVAGLCLGMQYPLHNAINLLWMVFTLMLFLFIGINFNYQRFNVYKLKWLGGTLAAVLLLMAGVISFNGNRAINLNNHFSKLKSRYLIGRIANEPKLNAGILRFIIKVEQSGDTGSLKAVTGNLIVSLKADTARQINLFYGDELLLPAQFNDIEPPLNPAEFDYRAYLSHQNIYQQTFLTQHQVRVLQHGKGNPVVGAALNLRVKLVNKLTLYIRDTDAVAVASTIILGYRADLRREVQETYAKTGTMHLLSVAGMHVGLIYGIIWLVLSLLPHNHRNKRIKAVITIVLIWCYALITGFSPAVSRAALMLTMVISGTTFNRQISRLNLLAVSAFILLLYNPFYITDVGFQLSYLAVAGILLMQPYVYRWFDISNRYLREVWLVCSVSIAAQIVLFPIGALYFHDFPVYFLVGNVFVVIPAAVVMYAGLLYLALPNLPFISSALAWLLQKTVTGMTKTLSWIEHAPYGYISKLWLNPAEFILVYILVISLFIALTKQNKQWLKAALVTCLLLSVSFSVKAYRAANVRSITFFSLHKNSGILFRDGNAAYLFTDLQPTDKAYQYSIKPYLDSCKINKLDTIGIKKYIHSNYLMKSGNLLQFGDKKLLILNRSSPQKTLPQKITVDYIYLTGNPHVNLQYLKQNYNFRLLLADGLNATRLINHLGQQAKQANIKFFNLKRNKALVIVSNR